MDRFKNVASNDPILRYVNGVVIGIVFFIGSSIVIINNEIYIEIYRDDISYPKALYLYLSSRMLTFSGFLYLVGSSLAAAAFLPITDIIYTIIALAVFIVVLVIFIIYERKLKSMLKEIESKKETSN